MGKLPILSIRVPPSLQDHLHHFADQMIVVGIVDMEYLQEVHQCMNCHFLFYTGMSANMHQLLKNRFPFISTEEVAFHKNKIGVPKGEGTFDIAGRIWGLGG